ncbi:MAG: hypothetical protein V7784_23340 [Oceanospirillaceae bacterium]
MTIKNFIRNKNILRNCAKLVNRMFQFFILMFIKYRIIKKVGLSTYKCARNKKIVSFPNELSHSVKILDSGYALEKVLLACGIKSRQYNPWVSATIIINWQDITDDLLDTNNYVSRSYEYTSRKLIRSINIKCTDISKKKIASIHKEAFGYDLDVNPLLYNGLAVKKSDSNATHDGVVIKCPLTSVDNDFVYNKLICNENGTQAIDYRVIYMNGVVDLFYEKRRNLNDRFSNTNNLTILRKIKDEFSEDEIEKIEKFGFLMAADYGEFDVLRDKDSKKIYIVDFAKTPFGPPNGLSIKDRLKSIEHMSVHFIKEVLIPLK